MTGPVAPEHPILEARARGAVSADVSFEQLYELYKRPVWAWLALRLQGADVDDLAQDVWTIFYRRWQGWRFGDEIIPEARPVLSFLFRTCHLTLAAFRRLQRRSANDALENADAVAADETWQRDLVLKECLATARSVCSSDELDILAGKLTGVSARTIARTIGVTESAVDHGYRRAIAKIRAALGASTADSGRSHV
jgi:DNA-directed RNA polymerase specialized sigma24 family protein